MTGAQQTVASTGWLLRQARAPGTLSLLVTVSLFVLLSAAGGLAYEGFLAPQVFLNLLIDNAFLLVVAVGLTFVILTGGIDLSVGAVVAFTTVLLASLVQHHGWHPVAAMTLALLLGSAFGSGMGFLIQRYRLQPFVVTLAGMFLVRGVATLISVESIGIDNEFQRAVAGLRIPLGGGASLSAGAVAALVVVGRCRAGGPINPVWSHGVRHRGQREFSGTDGAAGVLDHRAGVCVQRLLCRFGRGALHGVHA